MNKNTLHTIYCFLTILSVCLTTCHGAQPRLNTHKVPDNQLIKKVFPINHTNTSTLNVELKIPHEFEWASNLGCYILKTDCSFNWSKSITLYQYNNAEKNASQMADIVIQAATSKNKNTKQLTRFDRTCDSFSTTAYILLATCGDRREMYYITHYSGPKHFCTIQYGVALSSDMKVEKAFLDIINFVKKNIHIVETKE